MKNTLRSRFLYFILLLPFAGFSQNTNRSYSLPEGVSSSDFINGKLVVRFREDARQFCGANQVNVPGLEQTFAALGVTGAERTFKGKNKPVSGTDAFGREYVDLSLIYTLDINPAMDIVFAANQFLNSNFVEYAEPWFVYQTFSTPNDQLVPYQYYLNNIQAFDAWDVEQGDSTVVVGILDTGTSFTHSDFQGKFAFNNGDPIDGIDNDNDGYVDNYRGWDFGGASWSSGPDNDPTYIGTGPARDHGVLVTGPIAAVSNNNTGIASIGGRTKFLPLKTCIDNSTGISWGYQAVVYAADHGVNIMNLSWGGLGYNQFGLDAIRYATINKNCMVVVAAGNTHNETKYYPAAFKEVLSVAASSFSDNLWVGNGTSGTTYNTDVDITAPGHMIMTTAQYNIYWDGATGTSLSCPVVVGVCALVKAHFPGYHMEQVKERVRVTADAGIYASNPNPIYKNKLGKGRVNAYRALTAATPSIRIKAMAFNDHHNGIIEFGDTVEIRPVFYNYLDPSQQLQARLMPSNSDAFELIDSVVNLGQIQTLDSLQPAQGFRVRIKAFCQINQSFQLNFVYEDAGTNYSDFELNSIQVQPSVIDMQANNLQASFSPNGMVGFYRNNPQASGLGMRYQNNSSMSMYGSFLLANNGRTSDVTFNDQNGFDSDMYPVTRYTHETLNSTPGEKLSIVFDDHNSPNPLGVEIRENVYASSLPAYNKFLVLEYKIKNTGTDTLGDLFGGINSIFQMGGANGIAGFDSISKLTWYQNGSGLWGGIALLSQGTLHGGHFDWNPSTLNGTTKYSHLSQNHSNQNSIAGTSDNYASGSMQTLFPGQETTITFAMIGGSSLSDLYHGTGDAMQWYHCVLNPASNFPGLGPDQDICLGNTTTLNAGNGFIVYDWSTGSNAQTLQINQTGNYQVTATDMYGCSYSDSVRVTVHTPPTVSLPNDFDACGPVLLNSNSSLNCLWNTGQTTSSIMAQTTGTYDVQVVDGYGCAGYDTVNITMHEIDAVFSGPATVVETGVPAFFQDQTAGTLTWNWDFGDGGTATTGPVVSYAYDFPGTYSVQLEVSNGFCTDIASITIQVEQTHTTSTQNDLSNAAPIVFPTTNDGDFSVRMGQGMTGEYRVNLVGMDGRTIESRQASGAEFHFETQTPLANGIYLVEILNNNRAWTSRIIVKK